MHAVQYNQLQTVKLLLNAGADVNAQTQVLQAESLGNCDISIHQFGLRNL
jgi:hypothetical protein